MQMKLLEIGKTPSISLSLVYVSGGGVRRYQVSLQPGHSLRSDPGAGTGARETAYQRLEGR